MATKLIFNTEPKQLYPVKTGLEYRVDARTRREPKRVWPDHPTKQTWLNGRPDTPANREGYQAFKRENLSKAQELEFLNLMTNVHRLLKQRLDIDREYAKALDALAAFGPVPLAYEKDMNAQIREAIRLRRAGDAQ